MHTAGFVPRWLNRDLLYNAFYYPFVRLGCLKVFGEIPASNRKSLEFATKIGFKWEAVLKDVFTDGDLIITSMRREDCRWLGDKVVR